MTNEHRVKAAAELIRSYDRLHNIKDELNNYNLPALQKSAAVGHNKETRIKVAALIRQHEIEKQAFLNALGSLGKGLYNAGSTFAKGVGNAASEAMVPMRGALRQAKHNVMAPINTAGAAVQGFGQGLGQGAKSLMSLPGALAGNIGQGLSNAGNSLYKGFTGQLGTPHKTNGKFSLPSQSMPMRGSPMPKMQQAKPQYDPTLSLGQYSPLGQ